MSYPQTKTFYVFLSLVMVFALPFAHAAKKNNKNEIIDIKAQYVLLDEKKGISKYKGNVVFTKNTLIIKADAVTLYFKNEKLNKAVIKGTPADVQHQPENEAKVHSQAKTMEYFVTEERLILTGDAFVDQGERHFSGESIEYDTRQQTITANGKTENTSNSKNAEITPPKGRVHVIIGPRADSDKPGESIEQE